MCRPWTGLAVSTHIILVHTLVLDGFKDPRLDCVVEAGDSGLSGGGALSPLWDLARPNEDKERGSDEDDSQSIGLDRLASNSAPSIWSPGLVDTSGIDLQLGSRGRGGVALTVDDKNDRLALGLS